MAVVHAEVRYGCLNDCYGQLLSVELLERLLQVLAVGHGAKEELPFLI